MSDKKMKPVWRLNTGNGVPCDYGGLAYTPKAKTGVMDNYMDNATNNGLWSISGHSQDIYAYQTNRTKEAKYE